MKSLLFFANNRKRKSVNYKVDRWKRIKRLLSLRNQKLKEQKIINAYYGQDDRTLSDSPSRCSYISKTYNLVR